jgi:hypothetical protein
VAIASVAMNWLCNLGKSTIDICKQHPERVVWCFERIPATYQLLEDQLRQYSNYKLFLFVSCLS